MNDQEAHKAVVAAYPQSGKALERYVDLLASEGISRGLIGPREGDRLWTRHIANSVGLAPLLGQGEDVADIGSGAGLPGIPLALVRPDLRLALVEPLLRRSVFLAEAIEHLGLGDRVRVIRARAEDVDLAADTVTARAVASLAKLIGWTRPIWRGGRLLALKGQSAESEVVAAEGLLTRHGLSAHVLEVGLGGGLEGTRVIEVRFA
ncbi:MAG: 16S rRNA (guanine(527)-N(7))-methyltransferase RsmG [Arachnia sp.]